MSTLSGLKMSTLEWFNKEIHKLNTNRPEISSLPFNDKISILILVGTKSDSSYFDQEGMEFANLLGFENENCTLITCENSNIAKENLTYFFRGDEATKLVIYVGHGTGTKASFAFDFAGDLIPFDINDNSEDMKEKGRQRFLFMHEFIEVATSPQRTRDIFFFNFSCCALASYDVIKTWQRLNENLYLEGDQITFYVRCSGCEVRQLIKMNVNENIYTTESICQGISEVFKLFENYILNNNERVSLLSTQNRFINCSYEIKPNICESFKSPFDIILKKKDEREKYWEDEIMDNQIKCVVHNDKATIWQNYDQISSSNQMEVHGHVFEISTPEEYEGTISNKTNFHLYEVHVKNSRNCSNNWRVEMKNTNNISTLQNLCQVFNETFTDYNLMINKVKKEIQTKENKKKNRLHK